MDLINKKVMGKITSYTYLISYNALGLVSCNKLERELSGRIRLVNGSNSIALVNEQCHNEFLERQHLMIASLEIPNYFMEAKTFDSK